MLYFKIDKSLSHNPIPIEASANRQYGEDDSRSNNPSLNERSRYGIKTKENNFQLIPFFLDNFIWYHAIKCFVSSVNWGHITTRLEYNKLTAKSNTTYSVAFVVGCCIVCKWWRQQQTVSLPSRKRPVQSIVLPCDEEKIIKKLKWFICQILSSFTSINAITEISQ